MRSKEFVIQSNRHFYASGLYKMLYLLGCFGGVSFPQLFIAIHIKTEGQTIDRLKLIVLLGLC